MKMTSCAVSVLLGATMLAACGSAQQEQAKPDDAGPEAVSPAPATAEEDIRTFLLREYPDAQKIDYALAWTDLDGDGADEAIVSLGGPYFCGSGGCNLLVLAPAGPMWRKVGNVSVTRTPVTVLETASNGWKDMTVEIAGGGGPSGTVVLRFDGANYPGNASVAPAAPTDAKGAELLPIMPEYKTVTALLPAEPPSAN